MRKLHNSFLPAAHTDPLRGWPVMPMEHSGNSIEGSVIGGSRVTLEEAPRAPQTYVRSVTFRMKSTEYSRRLPAARIARRGGNTWRGRETVWQRRRSTWTV